MHKSALSAGKLFFDIYLSKPEPIAVVDIGSQDVNGSLRSVCPDFANYIGIDFTKGKGVDIVLEDPYKLPFEENTIDVVVSSSCFEHSEMFWLTFLEISRILKPSGLFYLNAPSACGFHRYPVDCYRFFPDSGNALAKWANRNGYKMLVLEHYTSGSDYICIFLKGEQFVEKYPRRCINYSRAFSCGCIYPNMSTFLFPDNLAGRPLSHFAPQLHMPGLFE